MPASVKHREEEERDALAVPWTAPLPLALAVATHHNGQGLVFVVGSVAGEEDDVDLDA